MNILKPPHKVKSKKVTNYKQIKKAVDDLKKFIVMERNEGLYKTAYSLAHCEVCENPFAFFVINPVFIERKIFKHQVFINPLIVGFEKKIEIENRDKDGKIFKKKFDNTMEVQEACMMFPHRRPKTMSRIYEIEVKYQTPTLLGLKTIKTKFEGLESQIFAHNCEHCEGKNIFFKK